jgi:hypothetical protein
MCWKGETAIVPASLDELRFLKPAGETLFVSIDLDFFYSNDHGQENVLAVLDALFSFSQEWRGQVVWAICLSRPWLPDDVLAWTLLDKTLSWLTSKPEFLPPEITLFTSRRRDESRMAQSFRARGIEPPSLREKDIPPHIKILIEQLLNK